jgi:hypothetical protein
MLLLLTLLLVCHFMADFTPLSTGWMLKAKQFGKPLLPILVHASVHAVLMLTVLLFFTDPVKAIQLAMIQLIAHFLIDTWKGRMGVWFPKFKDNTKNDFWMLMGFDQLLHQLTIVGMVSLL